MSSGRQHPALGFLTVSLRGRIIFAHSRVPVTPRLGRTLRDHRTAGRVALLALAAACSDGTGPDDRLAPVEVRVVGDSVSLRAVAATARLGAEVRRRGRVVAAPLRWFSGDDRVASLSSDGLLTARGAGGTFAFVVSDFGGRDSLAVHVRPEPARARMIVARTRLVHSRSFRFAAESRDAGGGPVTSGTVTWSSSDTTRLTVDQTGLVRAVSPGQARIRALVDGFIADTLVTVVPAPRLRFLRDTLVLGADQGLSNFDAYPFLLADDASDLDRATVTLGVADTSVASAPPLLTLPSSNVGAAVAWLQARGPGQTTVTATAPGWQPATAIVIVSSSRLRNAHGGHATVVVGGSAQAVRFDLLDSLGVRRDIVRRGVYRVSVSDTSVLATPADSVVVDGTALGVGVQLIARTAGTARVAVSREGYGADSVEVTVRAAGGVAMSFFTPTFPSSASGRMRTSVGHIRGRVSAGLPYFLDGPPQDIRLAQRAPQVVRLSDTLLVQGPGDTPPTFSVTGLAIGTDTVVATATGFAPDTLIVEVGVPGFANVYPLPPVIRSFERRPVGYGFADAGEVYPWSSTVAPVAVRVTSSDSSVLRPEPPEPSGGFPYVSAQGAGHARLRIESADGSYQPLELPPIEVLPVALYPLAFPESTTVRSLGTRTRAQIVAGPQGFVEWGGVRVLTPRSTDAGVVRLTPTDSVLLPGVFFVESGSQPGRAWIVLDAPGLVPDSISVEVTPSALVVRDATPLTAYEPERWWARLALVDALGNSHFHADSLTFDLTVSDSTVVRLLNAELTLGEWSQGTDPIRLQTLRPGTALVFVRDRRSGAGRFPDLAIPVTVTAPPE